jgi:hypothetical protein
MGTITDADLGQTVVSDGILKSVTMTAPPTAFSDDYFCLADDERIIYNVHISTTAFSTGSVLASGFYPFKNLIVRNIPKGCTFEYDLVEAPTLTSLSPDTAVSGDPDFTLSCMGTGFTSGSVIFFGHEDEPTTLVSDTEVTTIVKPSLFAPAVVPVFIRTGPLDTDPVDFTFTEPAVAGET